jgi:hypothetical protein
MQGLSLQGGGDPATRPDGKPPEALALPHAYGFLNVAEGRRGSCGAALKQACGRMARPGGMPVWGTLRWGMPNVSSTIVPTGVVESTVAWRTEVSWWYPEAHTPPVPRPSPHTDGARHLSHAHCDGSGERHGGDAQSLLAAGLCDLLAAPNSEMYRIIIAMELCEAGAHIEPDDEHCSSARHPQLWHTGITTIF